MQLVPSCRFGAVQRQWRWSLSLVSREAFFASAFHNGGRDLDSPAPFSVLELPILDSRKVTFPSNLSVEPVGLFSPTVSI